MLLLLRSLCLIVALLSISSLGSPLKTKTFSSSAQPSSNPRTSTSGSSSASAPSASNSVPNFTVAKPQGSCKALSALYNGTSPDSITKIGDPINSTTTGIRVTDTNTTTTTRKKTRSLGSLLAFPRRVSPRIEEEGEEKKEKVHSYAFKKTVLLTTAPLSSVQLGDKNLRVAKVVDASWDPEGPCPDNPYILKEVEFKTPFELEVAMLFRMEELYDYGRISQGRYYMVMLRIPGIPIVETRGYKWSLKKPETRPQWIEKGKRLTLDAMWAGYEKTRYVHGDAHPANVHYIEDCDSRGRCWLQKAALLDWGLVDKPRTKLTRQDFDAEYRPKIDSRWRWWFRKEGKPA